MRGAGYFMPTGCSLPVVFAQPIRMPKLEGVIPAKAGIHRIFGLLRKGLDSRLRGNDEISPSLLHLIPTGLNFFNILAGIYGADRNPSIP